MAAAEKKDSLSQKLLRSLDLFTCLFEFDIAVTAHVSEQALASIPIHRTTASCTISEDEYLEFYDVSVSDLKSFFPETFNVSVLDALIRMLKFTKHIIGDRVLVLDVLVLMCIAAKGTLEAKSHLLFSWFNISKTGLMDELEHTKFIVRVSSCLQKIKFLGALNISETDAKFMAFDARAKMENGEIVFLPGLYVKDFKQWILTNEDCNAIFRGIRLLGRLVEVLMFMNSRVDSVLALMEEKRQAPYRMIDPVPELTSLQFSRYIPTVSVVYRNQKSVSICVPFLRADEDEIFVKCDKVMLAPQPLYDIPVTIASRNEHTINQVKAVHNLKCCDKVYSVTSYQKALVQHSAYGAHTVPLRRIDVVNLDPASRYIITLYTHTQEYKAVDTCTLPTEWMHSVADQEKEEQKQMHHRHHHHQQQQRGTKEEEEEEGESMSSGGKPSSLWWSRNHLCIFPASCSVETMREALYEIRQQEEERQEDSDKSNSGGDTWGSVFTGSLCNIDATVMQCLKSFASQVDLHSGLDVERFIVSAAAAVKMEYERTWVGRAWQLLSMGAAVPLVHATLDSPLKIDQQHLLYYSGCGAMQSLFDDAAGAFSQQQQQEEEKDENMSDNVANTIKQVLTSTIIHREGTETAAAIVRRQYRTLRSILDSLLNRFAGPLLPPKFQWELGRTRLLFVAHSRDADSSSVLLVRDKRTGEFELQNNNNNSNSNSANEDLEISSVLGSAEGCNNDKPSSGTIHVKDLVLLMRAKNVLDDLKPSMEEHLVLLMQTPLDLFAGNVMPSDRQQQHQEAQQQQQQHQQQRTRRPVRSRAAAAAASAAEPGNDSVTDMTNEKQEGKEGEKKIQQSGSDPATEALPPKLFRKSLLTKADGDSSESEQVPRTDPTRYKSEPSSSTLLQKQPFTGTVSAAASSDGGAEEEEAKDEAKELSGRAAAADSDSIKLRGKYEIMYGEYSKGGGQQQQQPMALGDGGTAAAGIGLGSAEVAMMTGIVSSTLNPDSEDSNGRNEGKDRAPGDETDAESDYGGDGAAASRDDGAFNESSFDLHTLSVENATLAIEEEEDTTMLLAPSIIENVRKEEEEEAEEEAKDEPLPQEEKGDETLRALVVELQRWLRAGRWYSDPHTGEKKLSRSVTLVSCNWVSGYNFDWVVSAESSRGVSENEDLVIRHVNLLPTANTAATANIANTATAANNYHTNSTQTSPLPAPFVATATDVSICAMKVIRASLPPGCIITVHEERTSHRALHHCTGSRHRMSVSTSSDAVANNSFAANNNNNPHSSSNNNRKKKFQPFFGCEISFRDLKPLPARLPSRGQEEEEKMGDRSVGASSDGLLTAEELAAQEVAVGSALERQEEASSTPKLRRTAGSSSAGSSFSRPQPQPQQPQQQSTSLNRTPSAEAKGDSLSLESPSGGGTAPPPSRFPSKRSMFGREIKLSTEELLETMCIPTVPKTGIFELTGPNILRVSSRNALIGAKAVGFGTIQCTIYEAPMHMQYRDAISIVSLPDERSRLLLVNWQRKKVNSSHSREFLFRFDNLCPYCAYCVVLESVDDLNETSALLFAGVSSYHDVVLKAQAEAAEAAEEAAKLEAKKLKKLKNEGFDPAAAAAAAAPSVPVLEPPNNEYIVLPPCVALFRTLTVPSTTAGSFLLVAVSEDEAAGPTERAGKIAMFADGTDNNFRGLVPTVYAMSIESSTFPSKPALYNNKGHENAFLKKMTNFVLSSAATCGEKFHRSFPFVNFMPTTPVTAGAAGALAQHAAAGGRGGGGSLGASSTYGKSNIFVSFHGSMCYINLKYADASCVLSAVDVVRALRYDASILCVIVLSPVPLVRHLRRAHGVYRKSATGKRANRKGITRGMRNVYRDEAPAVEEEEVNGDSDSSDDGGGSPHRGRTKRTDSSSTLGSEPPTPLSTAPNSPGKSPMMKGTNKGNSSPSFNFAEVPPLSPTAAAARGRAAGPDSGVVALGIDGLPVIHEDSAVAADIALNANAAAVAANGGDLLAQGGGGGGGGNNNTCNGNNSSAKWVHDGPVAESRSACAVLFAALLAWKARRSGNDCKIITLAEVKRTQCVVVRPGSYTTGIVRSTPNYVPPATGPPPPPTSASAPKPIIMLESGELGEYSLSSIQNAVDQSHHHQQQQQQQAQGKGVLEGSQVQQGYGGSTLLPTFLQGGATTSYVEQHEIVHNVEELDRLNDLLAFSDSLDFGGNKRHDIAPSTKFDPYSSLFSGSVHLEASDAHIPHYLRSAVKTKPPSAAVIVDELADDATINTQDKMMREFYEEFGNSNLYLQHVILPTAQRPLEWDSNVLFPAGKFALNEFLECERLLDFPEGGHFGITQCQPRSELYGSTITYKEDEPLVYQIEVLLHRDAIEEAKQLHHGSSGSNLDANTATSSGETESSNQHPHLAAINHIQHPLTIRPLVSEFDLLEVTVGPLIGAITATSVKVLFEINMSVKQFMCVLQPVDGQSDPSEQTVQNVEANAVILFSFNNLLPTTKYRIYLPEIYGSVEPVGSFQTVKQNIVFAQIAVAGAGSMTNLPTVAELVSQVCQQQSPSLLDMAMINRGDAATTRQARELGGSHGGGLVQMRQSMWHLLYEHLSVPGVPTTAIFHMGSHAPLASQFEQLAGAMLAAAQRIQLPVNEASAVGSLYFKQFEEILKDTFRVFYASDPVRSVFSMVSNIPIYKAAYLLPTPSFVNPAGSGNGRNVDLSSTVADSDPATAASIATAIKNKKKSNLSAKQAAALAAAEAEAGITAEEPQRSPEEERQHKMWLVLRRVFESNTMAYISSLYGWSPDKGTSASTPNGQDVGHSLVWRMNSLAVVNVDLTTGRTKIKNKKKEDGISDSGAHEEEDTAASAATKNNNNNNKNNNDNEEEEVGGSEGGKSSKIMSKKEKKDAEKATAAAAAVVKGGGGTAAASVSAVPQSIRTFSLGFLEKVQWRLLRDLSLDNNITHLVIVTEKPFIPLTSIPKTYEAPDSVAKGSTLPWAPTVDDLEMFLRFWIDWLAMYQRKVIPYARNFILVSSHDVAYSTVVQDLKTGLKLTQLCIGNFNEGVVAESRCHPHKKEDVKMAGKIGSMRYVHRLEGQHLIEIDTARAEASSARSYELIVEAAKAKAARSSAAAAATTAGDEDEKRRVGTETDGDGDGDGAVTGEHGNKPLLRPASGSASAKMAANAQSNSSTIDAVVKTRNAGFGVLKLWFDSWKALGIYECDVKEVQSAQDDEKKTLKHYGSDEESEEEKETAVVGGDNSSLLGDVKASLTIGPVIGAPSLLAEGANQFMMIPIMIEVDERTNIVIEATSVFSGRTERYVFSNVLPYRPYVYELGPLELNDRYNMEIISGLAETKYNSFTVNTNVSPEDCNLAVVNCELTPDTFASSDFLIDLVKRYKVPFNGICATVHTNFQPNFQLFIDNFKTDPLLLAELQNSRMQGNKLTVKLREKLVFTMELCRNMFRDIICKPSFREALRTGMNLMMQNIVDVLYEEVDYNEESPHDQAVRLLTLIIARFNQEYFEKLTVVHPNVFRAVIVGDREYWSSHRKAKKMTANPSNEQMALDAVAGARLAGTGSSGAAAGAVAAAAVSGGGVISGGSMISLGAQSNASNERKAIGVDNYKALVNDDLQSVHSSTAGIPLKFHWINPSIDAVDAVFFQWSNNMHAAPYRWSPWVSPNGKVCVEQLRGVRADNADQIVEQIERAPLREEGVRILILNDQPTGSEESAAAELLDTNSPFGAKVQETLINWVGERTDRAFSLVCPSLMYGTKKMTVDFPNIPMSPQKPRIPQGLSQEETQALLDAVALDPTAEDNTTRKASTLFMLDSVYRSNEFARAEQQAEMEKQFRAKQEKLKKEMAAAAKSKRAKLKFEEEAAQQKEEMNQALQDLHDAQIPDGYIIIDCTSLDIVAQKDYEPVPAVLTTTHTRIVSSEPAEEIERQVKLEMAKMATRADATPDPALLMELTPPTAYDYLQVPKWLQKYAPGNNSVFVQDEVILFMRQHVRTRAVIDFIESGELNPAIVAFYARSRLSELSRPADLREVDMEIEGVIPMFFKDIINRLWVEIVPPKIKGDMFNLCDDFVRSFCFYKALETVETLSSAADFAAAVQKALLLAVEMKTAIEMSRLTKFDYIWDIKDPTEAAVARQEKKSAEVARIIAENEKKQRENLEAGIPFVEEVVAAELSQKIADTEAGIDAADGYESDLDDLDKEQAEIERLIKQKEEEEDEAERLKEEAEELAELEEQSENSSLAKKVKAKDKSSKSGAIDEEEDDDDDEDGGRVGKGGGVGDKEKPAAKVGDEDLDDMLEKKQKMTLELLDRVIELVENGEIEDAVLIAGREKEDERLAIEAEKKRLAERLTDDEIILQAKARLARMRIEKRESNKSFGERITFLC